MLLRRTPNNVALHQLDILGERLPVGVSDAILRPRVRCLPTSLPVHVRIDPHLEIPSKVSRAQDRPVALLESIPQLSQSPDPFPSAEIVQMIGGGLSFRLHKQCCADGFGEKEGVVDVDIRLLIDGEELVDGVDVRLAPYQVVEGVELEDDGLLIDFEVEIEPLYFWDHVRLRLNLWVCDEEGSAGGTVVGSFEPGLETFPAVDVPAGCFDRLCDGLIADGTAVAIWVALCQPRQVLECGWLKCCCEEVRACLQCLVVGLRHRLVSNSLS